MPRVRTAYVQKEGNDWINETAFTMASGCEMLGIDVIPFRSKDINDLELSQETLVHGWVSMVRRALVRLNVPEPHVDSLQEELLPFYGRHVYKTTLGEVRMKRGLFVKPATDHKAFTGLVLNDSLACLTQISPFPDEMGVVVSERVEFVTEYRLFVHKGVIVGAKNYRGDFTKIVDFDVAWACIRAFKTAPISYSLDLGLTDDGRTLVVEVNDAFSLGSYGLPALIYAQLVEDRWGQMMGTALPSI